MNFENFWPIDYVNEKVTKTQRAMYKFVYFCFKCLLVSGMFVGIVVLFSPLFESKKRLPLEFYHFVDFYQTPLYEITYLWILLNSIFIYCLVIGLSGIFYSLLCFVYCQTEMLKEQLRNLNLGQINCEEDEKKLFLLMKIYIKYTTKLMKYFEKLNQAYSMLLLTDLITNVPGIAMPLLQATLFG